MSSGRGTAVTVLPSNRGIGRFSFPGPQVPIDGWSIWSKRMEVVGWVVVRQSVKGLKEVKATEFGGRGDRP